jgi:hypothetical protein
MIKLEVVDGYAIADFDSYREVRAEYLSKPDC